MRPYRRDGDVASRGGNDAPAFPCRLPARTACRLAGTVLTNGRWLVFEALRNMAQGASLGVTTVEGPPERPWTRVPLRQSGPTSRDGQPMARRCIFWPPTARLSSCGEALNPARGVVVGEPVQLTHFDSPSFNISPAMSSTEMDVGGGRVFMTMESRSGSIWMLDNVDR